MSPPIFPVSTSSPLTAINFAPVQDPLPHQVTTVEPTPPILNATPTAVSPPPADTLGDSVSRADPVETSPRDNAGQSMQVASADVHATTGASGLKRLESSGVSFNSTVRNNGIPDQLTLLNVIDFVAADRKLLSLRRSKDKEVLYEVVQTEIQWVL